jgi:hypothetical protein
VPRDPVRALALVSIASSNAPAEERVWIDDTYQNIFCASNAADRLRASKLVADARKASGRRRGSSDRRAGLDDLLAQPLRTCADGEKVVSLSDWTTEQASRDTEVPRTPSPPAVTGTLVGTETFLRGSVAPASSIGTTDVGTGFTSTPPK